MLEIRVVSGWLEGAPLVVGRDFRTQPRSGGRGIVATTQGVSSRAVEPNEAPLARLQHGTREPKLEGVSNALRC